MRGRGHDDHLLADVLQEEMKAVGGCGLAPPTPQAGRTVTEKERQQLHAADHCRVFLPCRVFLEVLDVGLHELCHLTRWEGGNVPGQEALRGGREHWRSLGRLFQ